MKSGILIGVGKDIALMMGNFSCPSRPVGILVIRQRRDNDALPRSLIIRAERCRSAHADAINDVPRLAVMAVGNDVNISVNKRRQLSRAAMPLL